MAKNRSSVYTVVREKLDIVGHSMYDYLFDAVIGVYKTPEAADEAAGIARQVFDDAGMSAEEYIFSVQISTYYDE